MQSKHVKLTVPDNLYKQSTEIAREFVYSNVQDLTIESLRKHVLELRRAHALEHLKNNFGSANAKPRLTKLQKEKTAREHTPKRAREIAKKYGVDDIAV